MGFGRQTYLSAAFLSASSALSLLIPIVELPLLTRILGPEDFGAFTYVVYMASLAAIVVEYGFTYSAARLVGQAKGDPQKLATIFTTTTASKLILFLAVGTIVVFYAWCVVGDGLIDLVPFCLVYLLAYGFGPAWYFIGRSRLVVFSIYDIAVRLTGTAALFVFSGQLDLAGVLWIYLVTSLLNTLGPNLVILKTVGFRGTGLHQVLSALRTGFPFFAVKGVSNLTGYLPTLLLGTTQPMSMIGLYASADRALRAGSGAASAGLNAFFSGAVTLHSADSGRGRREIFLLTTLIGFAALVVSAVTAIFAEQIVNLLFGEEFSASAGILQVLVWALPLRVTALALSTLVLIPAGRERAVLRNVTISVVVLVLAGTPLIFFFGLTGTPYAVLLSEFALFGLHLCSALKGGAR